MRVLIIGGGVAGLTLAAKLRQGGCDATIVERSDRYDDAGYGIGVYGPGNSILRELGVYDELVAHARVITSYQVGNRVGRMLRKIPMGDAPADVGPLMMLPRSDLVKVLRSAAADVDVRMGTTAAEIEPAGRAVRAVFDDGDSDYFDLAVACDGRNSTGRRWIGAEPLVTDTRWTYWTWWGPEGLFPDEAMTDYFGRRWFLGAYPAPGRCMFGVFLPPETASDPHATAQTMRRLIADTLGEFTDAVPAVRDAVDQAERLYAWRMEDIVLPRWHSGRVALCGDAAATPLPVAGAGAMHAMQVAAALAEEIAKVNTSQAPAALEEYAKRCQIPVKRHITQSRMLTRSMVMKSRGLIGLRDRVVTYYLAKHMIPMISKSSERY